MPSSKRKSGGTNRRLMTSLLPEGLAVGTLIHGRILLVCADENAVQRAVVLGVAVIGALLNGAFDALVCLAAHDHFLLFVGSKSVYPNLKKACQEKTSNSCNYCDSVI